MYWSPSGMDWDSPEAYTRITEVSAGSKMVVTLLPSATYVISVLICLKYLLGSLKRPVQFLNTLFIKSGSASLVVCWSSYAAEMCFPETLINLGAALSRMFSNIREFVYSAPRAKTELQKIFPYHFAATSKLNLII
ncbi:hypothetical protein TNCV_1912341 [Trichonephila clavipes]|nr:hypothetical protein TNCV_1912341 [Trichonephila clavipes]